MLLPCATFHGHHGAYGQWRLSTTADIPEYPCFLISIYPICLPVFHTPCILFSSSIHQQLDTPLFGRLSKYTACLSLPSDSREHSTVGYIPLKPSTSRLFPSWLDRP